MIESKINASEWLNDTALKVCADGWYILSASSEEQLITEEEAAEKMLAYIEGVKQLSEDVFMPFDDVLRSCCLSIICKRYGIEPKHLFFSSCARYLKEESVEVQKEVVWYIKNVQDPYIPNFKGIDVQEESFFRDVSVVTRLRERYEAEKEKTLEMIEKNRKETVKDRMSEEVAKKLAALNAYFDTLFERVKDIAANPENDEAQPQVNEAVSLMLLPIKRKGIGVRKEHINDRER